MGGAGGVAEIAGAALQDRALEQPPGSRHREQRADGHRARGLAEDGDASGISAESGDIVVHPFQGRDLIEQGDIGHVVEEEESFGAQPVVERDEDHSVAGEGTAVVEHVAAGIEAAP